LFVGEEEEEEEEEGTASSGSSDNKEHQQKRQQALLLYASPAAVRAVRSCAIANSLLLACWSNLQAACSVIGEWWAAPSTTDLQSR
jgi:hypothetical protein